MIKVNILYPNNEGTWFDLDYYCKVHMPMSIRMLSRTLKGVSIESGLSGTTPGSKPTYIALCHLRFESVDAFLAAFSPHAQELQGDIAKFTNVEPVIQFSEEKIFQ